MSTEQVHCILASNAYGHYAVPMSCVHRPASRAILSGGIFEPQTVAFMRENCGDRDIVHAGTFFGDFLPALSAAIAPNAILWAFEPNPESHACATWTLRLNNISNCRLHQAGLGAERGTLPLVTHQMDDLALGGASTFVNQVGRSTSVGVLRVDDAVGERPVGILQLDVEHFEEQALTGALKTIQRNRPIAILETVPSEAWWSKHMTPLGYERVGKVHGNTIFRAKG